MPPVAVIGARLGLALFVTRNPVPDSAPTGAGAFGGIEGGVVFPERSTAIRLAIDAAQFSGENTSDFSPSETVRSRLLSASARVEAGTGVSFYFGGGGVVDFEHAARSDHYFGGRVELGLAITSPRTPPHNLRLEVGLAYSDLQVSGAGGTDFSIIQIGASLGYMWRQP